MSVIIRVKYEKKEEVKYVGHLDMMRTFMRCLKRTNLPLSFSKGFNPRIKISFALPLGVGVTSNSEYFDLELEDKINIDIFLAELNSVLPEGLKVLEAYYPKKDDSLMSLVREAIYEIKIEDDVDFKAIKKLFEKDEILLEKESKDKKKINTINIKEYIIDYEVKDDICSFHVFAGSLKNLNPSNIIEAINKYISTVDDYNINRKKLILEEQ